MEIKTINYNALEENIANQNEAFKLANVTFEPSVIIERVDGLLDLFLETYIDTEENRKNLSEDIIRRPNIVMALVYSIVHQTKDVVAMLQECQNHEVRKIEKIY